MAQILIVTYSPKNFQRGSVVYLKGLATFYGLIRKKVKSDKYNLNFIMPNQVKWFPDSLKQHSVHIIHWANQFNPKTEDSSSNKKLEHSLDTYLIQ